jgi:hypothetical protein
VTDRPSPRGYSERKERASAELRAFEEREGWDSDPLTKPLWMDIVSCMVSVGVGVFVDAMLLLLLIEGIYQKRRKLDQPKINLDALDWWRVKRSLLRA